MKGVVSLISSLIHLSFVYMATNFDEFVSNYFAESVMSVVGVSQGNFRVTYIYYHRICK